MKYTDLKREHFPNGDTFTQKSLDQYVAARVAAQRDFFTRYLLSLAVGVVAGFVVLTLVPTGMLRIFLAMLAVMIAAMIGTKMTAKSLEALRGAAAKISLTRQSLREAKKHLRNGTTAWQDKREKLDTPAE